MQQSWMPKVTLWCSKQTKPSRPSLPPPPSLLLLIPRKKSTFHCIGTLFRVNRWPHPPTHTYTVRLKIFRTNDLRTIRLNRHFDSQKVGDTGSRRSELDRANQLHAHTHCHPATHGRVLTLIQWFVGFFPLIINLYVRRHITHWPFWPFHHPPSPSTRHHRGNVDSNTMFLPICILSDTPLPYDRVLLKPNTTMSNISSLGDEREFVLHTSLMHVPPRRSCFEANKSINHDILALAPSQGLIIIIIIFSVRFDASPAHHRTCLEAPRQWLTFSCLGNKEGGVFSRTFWCIASSPRSYLEGPRQFLTFLI